MHSVSSSLLPENAIGTADRAAAVTFGAAYATRKKIVFVVNNDRFFLTHRASWATALRSSGADITVIAQDTGHAGDIRDLGFDFVKLHFGRESISIFQAATAGIRLLFLLLKIRPNVVFLVATAAYVLGWPAALLLRNARFIRVVAGAGRALESNVKNTKASGVVRSSLRFSSRLPNVLSLFQIRSNLDAFISGGLTAKSRSFVIPGTGIDTESWLPPIRNSLDPIVVLFAARLFHEKGIYEFVELARRMTGKDVKFVVAGEPDYGVTSSVKVEELEAWQEQGIVEYLGRCDDMRAVFSSSDILVFPSTHPEGTPRVLIEAAACGVVAVASDQPGCREVVAHGTTGLIVDAKDVPAFERALNSLISDHGFRQKLSEGARARACSMFSIEATLLEIFKLVEVQVKR